MITNVQDEQINSSYYSATYFITLFTSVLQQQTEFREQCNLLRFFDHFIVVFRCVTCMCRADGKS